MKLREGDRAVILQLPSTLGALSAERYSGKWLVLYFYQRDYSESSWMDLKLLNSRINEIRKLNGDVVGISPDDLQVHMRFAVERGIAFELASDQRGDLASMYGALRSRDPLSFRRMAALVSPQGELFKLYRSRRGAMHIFELISNLKALNRLSGDDPPSLRIIYFV